MSSEIGVVLFFHFPPFLPSWFSVFYSNAVKRDPFLCYMNILIIYVTQDCGDSCNLQRVSGLSRVARQMPPRFSQSSGLAGTALVKHEAHETWSHNEQGPVWPQRKSQPKHSVCYMKHHGRTSPAGATLCAKKKSGQSGPKMYRKVYFDAFLSGDSSYSKWQQLFWSLIDPELLVTIT